MSYGSGSLGTASFGAPVAPTPSTGVTINCSIGNAVAVGIPASITSPIVYDYKIAVIGDSNASGRCTNNQPAPVGNTWLYNNSGAVVALADPWDGGPDTYSALEDTSATGSFIPRLAQHFYDAGKTTLWVPANKGGTQTSNWARSLSTTTPYGAMKARIDAAGGVDKILILLGANDAISGVSQSLFVSRMNQLVIDLLSDFPGVEVYLEKVHEFTGYGSQVTVIRAGVTEVWNGTSGVKPGADLDGISPNNVHYTTDADATAVAQRTYPTLIGDIIHGVVGNAVAAGVPATISSIPTHSATGVVTGLTSNVTGTANRYRLHTTTGAATGLTSTVTGSATIQPAPGIHVTSGDVVAGVGIVTGSALHIGVHPTTGVLAGFSAEVIGAAQRSGAVIVHDTSGVLAGYDSVVTGAVTNQGSMTLTPADIQAIVAALKAEILPVNIVRVNNIDVDGTGADSDPWGPV